MARHRLILGLVATFCATTVAAEERRQLGPHEHGRSVLDIAVEGTRVAMELRAPGIDIVGFEHPAETDEQRAALERAEAALADPLALFVPPPAAGCRLGQATVELETEDHGEEHAGAAPHAEDGDGHADFHAGYALECGDPRALDSITFAFFERFPGAREVGVTLVTEHGQTAFEVEREAPRARLGAVM